MTNLESILKSRDITLPTKICLVKVMVFPVVMYGCESWTIKKAEHWQIDAFELWCWRRLLRVPWPAGRSNQSILKEISSEYSLEGLMLKLKLQYLGHLMWRTDSFEKTLMLGNIEGGRRRGQHVVRWHHWLDGHEFELAPGVGDGPEAWCVAVHGVAKSQTQLSDWTELIVVCLPDSRGENMNPTSWWKEYHPVIEYRMADTFGCPFWKIESASLPSDHYDLYPCTGCLNISPWLHEVLV